MRKFILFLGFVLILGCARRDALTEREKGALIGSGVGAGIGAIVGNQTGHAGAGTAIGAGTGALAGGLIGESQRRERLGREQKVTVAFPERTVTDVYTGEIHTKFNPKTGQTFPERFEFDPKTGEKLEPIR